MALGILFSGGVVANAQDDDAESPSMPAFVEAGDCSDLNPNPAATLNALSEIGAPAEEGDEEAGPVEGTLSASRVLTSVSEDVDLSFDDMLAESHSVTVHLSEDKIQTYVACGEIGGIVNDDQLVIALHSVDESGYTGIALLTKDGDGNADVTVYLSEPVVPEPSPDATPAG
jgi:hypothetical protein